MFSPIQLYQGDSSELFLVRPNIANPNEVISNDWVCKSTIVDEDGGVIVAVRNETTKTDDDLNFVVGLSPTDTLAIQIPAGEKYVRAYWVVQVSNSQLQPAYSREKRFDLIIKPQAITS